MLTPALALIDVALLAYAGWVAVTTLNRRVRPALGLVLVAILASAVPLYIGAGDAAILRFTAAVVAAATARREVGWAKGEIPDVYPGTKRTRAWEPVVVGLLAGLVVAGHPAYVPLAVGLMLLVTGAQRRAVVGVATLVCALGVSLLPAPIGDGWIQALAVGEWVPGVETLWAALEFGVGRSFGILPFFVPVILLIGLHQFRGPGGPVIWTSVASCAALLLAWPFDWLPSVARPGNGWFLPVYGALLMIPAKPARGWALVPVGLVAVVFLAPHWWGLLPGIEGMKVREATPVSRFLPLEALPRVGVEERLSVGALEAWSPDMDIDRGAWRNQGGDWGSLVITSQLRVAKVWLDCGGQAGSQIEVQGARGGETLFRADGGVGFALDLPAGRRHRTAWTDSPVHVYAVRFRLPAAPDAPIRVRLLEEVGLAD